MCIIENIISDALDKLRGAITIVYPMNLPPYDVIRQEFEGIEDLSGTQVLLLTVKSCSIILIQCSLVGWTTGVRRKQYTVMVGW